MRASRIRLICSNKAVLCRVALPASARCTPYKQEVGGSTPSPPIGETCRSSPPGRVSAGHEARATLAARDYGRFLYLTFPDSES